MVTDIQSSDWGGVVAAATAELRGVAGRPAAVHTRHVSPRLAEIGALMVAAAAARFALVEEAISRGVVSESDSASAVDWVLENCPQASRGEAAQLVRVVQACQAPKMGILGDAVAQGRVSVGNAAVALAEFGSLEPRLTDEARETVLQGFVDIAADCGPREIRELRSRIIATYGGQGEFQIREDRLKRQTALSQPVDDDGVKEYRLRLDPEASAVLEAALGPLAAPRPSTEGGPDLRGSDERRGEALIEIVRRGVAAAEGVPVTDKATLFVTMDFDGLRDRTGSGSTLTGDLLAPETVRRLACDASLIPMVLGTTGEILDVGRTLRLCPPKMLKALWIRDGGCTFPGCSRPSTWCDAHHVVHWANGGATDLSNMALLCARHHTKVHQRDFRATVDAAGVTWHV